jgi:hypothetical protein
MIARRKVFGLVVGIITVSAFVLIALYILETSRLERAIRALSSADFMAMRKAQMIILDLGPTVVPVLAERIPTTTDPQAKALLFSLIGKLDPSRYVSLLIEVANHTNGDVCTALRYGIGDAVPAMLTEDVVVLRSAYMARNERERSEERKKCMEPLLRLLENKM